MIVMGRLNLVRLMAWGMVYTMVLVLWRYLKYLERKMHISSCLHTGAATMRLSSQLSSTKLNITGSFDYAQCYMQLQSLKIIKHLFFNVGIF